jgi:KaiC/GvpD/RAD55 family RecA-like ATPase
MLAAGADGMKTGVAGLDEIPGDGLTPKQIYLPDGNPGAGKTMLVREASIASAPC